MTGMQAGGRRAGLGCMAWVVGMLVLATGRAFAASDAYAWGWNGLGQLGTGTTDNAPVALAVAAGARPPGVQWTRVASGGAHGLALGTDGRAYAWGDNGSGQLGDGTSDPVTRAVVVSRGVVPLGVLLTAISAGGQHSVALGSDGKLYAWGENEHGQLGDGTTTDRAEPVEVVAGAIPSGVQVTAVSAGWEHTVALGSDGRAYAWGRNASGQLGTGSYFGSVEPVAVASGTVTFSQVAAGRFHTLALGSDGLMRAWGANASGQLGDGAMEGRPTPGMVSAGAIPGGATVVAIASGWLHSLALTGSGRVYAWGGNGSGQVGDGTLEDRLMPVEVTGLGAGASIGKIAANGSFSVASGPGGTLYGWGANEFGQLGDGTTVGRVEATLAARGAVRVGVEIEDLAAGPAHVLALADGPPPLEAPVVYGGRVEGTYGAAVSGAVLAEGASIVEYGAVGLPAGLMVDPATGAVSGVAGQAGTFTVTVTARNAAGIRSGQMTVELARREVTVQGHGVRSREYDGTGRAMLTGTGLLAGVLVGDDVTLEGVGTGTFADAKVGEGKGVTVEGYSLGGSDAGKYRLGTVTVPGTITARVLTVGGLGESRKVYDGGLGATLVGSAALVGVVEGDEVTLGGAPTATYDAAGAGARTVNVSGYVLEGADAGNYTLGPVAETTGWIEALALTVEGLAASGRVYDGTLSVEVGGTPVISGMVAGDEVTVSGTPAGVLATADAGEGRAVTVVGLTLGGAAAANYRVVSPALTATVTRKVLGLTGLVVASRTYNGGTVATVQGTPSLVGALAGDAVTVTGVATGQYADAEVGEGKVVTVTGLGLGGAQGGNYELGPVTLSGSITAPDPAATVLTLSGLGVGTREYDGTRAATLTGTAVLNGVMAGDDVSLAGALAAEFVTKDVGEGKAVVVSGYVLAGADASRYRVEAPVLTGRVTRRTARLGGLVAGSRDADGTSAVALSGAASVVGWVAGDDVALGGSGSGSFADAGAGLGRRVTVSGYALTGVDAGNYELELPRLRASVWAVLGSGEIQGVYGWGGNSDGRLGNGGTTDAGVPVGMERGALPSGARWLEVSGGGGHGVGLGSDGWAYAWGGNASGQVGDGTTEQRVRRR